MKLTNGFHAHWNTEVSSSCTFEEYVYLSDGASVFNSRLGRFSRVSAGTVSNADIGAFTSIGPRAQIGGGGSHPLNQVSTHSAFYQNNPYRHPHCRLTNESLYPDELRKVVVGNDVWIGAAAIIREREFGAKNNQQ